MVMKAKKINISLKTITPVHIGNGETLYPNFDYVYRNGKIYILKPSFINEKTIRNDGEKNFSEMYNNISDDILKKNSKLVISVDVSAERDIKDKVIVQNIVSANKVYIPGSTIKGSIRTALIWKYIEEFGEKNVIQREEYYDKKTNKKHSNIIIKERQVFNFVDKNNDRNILDAFSFINVSDTNYLLYQDTMSVFLARRFHFKGEKKNKQGIPQLFEGIKVGVIFNFEISLKLPSIDYMRKKIGIHIKKQDEDRYNFLYNYIGINGDKDILSVINEFYNKTREKILENIEATDIKSIYNKIDFKGNIMRIGWGKTYYDNSIGISLPDKYIFLLLKEKKLGKHVDKNIFPSTGWFIVEGDKPVFPLGWISLKHDG